MPTIFEQALAVKEYCTKCRRHLHQNPELSLQEFKTTAFIKQELATIGIPILDIDLTVGIVAVIEGQKKGDGPVTALRADIDALAMNDNSGKPYASKICGVAHTCGHDGHTAVLLGVAKVLYSMRYEFSGTVKLVFQPGEEGKQGSLLIIKAGALENPTVDSIVCLHCWPYFQVGEIGAWPGQYMASSDIFLVRITGQSGHGARPYKAVNPINAAAHCISLLQGIIPNEITTSQQAVMTVCKIHGGESAFNIIPDMAEFGATVRCLDETVRDELEARIRRTVEGVASSLGCKAELKYTRGQPSLYNDEGVVKDLLSAAQTALGDRHVRELDGPVMGAEDFSYLINHVGKGAFFRLGVGVGEKEPVALHNSRYDFNDDAIPYGVATMVQYIMNRHS